MDEILRFRVVVTGYVMKGPDGSAGGMDADLVDGLRALAEPFIGDDNGHAMSVTVDFHDDRGLIQFP